MRSTTIVSFLVPALLYSVNAAPYKYGDTCGQPSVVTVTSTYTGPEPITGVPAPSEYNTPSRWITGVPAPSEYNTPSRWITGVPAPSDYPIPPSSWISGVPAPSDYNPPSSWITSVPKPSNTPSFTYIASEPTSLPIPSTTSNLPSSTSTIPKPSSCRPSTWTREGKAPSTGTLRAAVIFVDFSDAPANETVEEHYSLISSAPAEWYNTTSYGKLNLELVPLLDQFYRMPKESTAYNYSRGLTTETHVSYIQDALTAVGPSVSFSGIDVLYVLPAKYANAITTSTSTAVDVTALDGSVINTSITFGQDLYFSWGFKAINHETGHAMGLPDLYPYSAGDVWQWVGGYDIMGLISGQSGDYFAWHKWQLDWIVDGQVDCVADAGNTFHRVGPIEVDGNTAKAIAIPVNGTTYVMAEVRSNLGINTDACGTGVLLYTADTATLGGDGPIRVLDSKPASGGCGGEGKGGELNDAPLAVGESFDTGLGVIVRVLEKNGDDYVVEVEKLSR